MDALSFFKLQAKNFLHDWKTRYHDEEPPYDVIWQYRPSFFEIGDFFNEFGDGMYEYEEPSLMRSQHFIALMCGRDSWSDLINLPEDELEFLKSVWEHQSEVSVEDFSSAEDMLAGMGLTFATAEDKEIYYEHMLEVARLEGAYGSGYLLPKPPKDKNKKD